jgi:hypothetical protein
LQSFFNYVKRHLLAINKKGEICRKNNKEEGVYKAYLILPDRSEKRTVQGEYHATRNTP